MLKNKTAIITGGTRGIGFSIVKRYLENGASVAVAGSRQESVEKALSGLGDYKERVMGIWPNLCNPVDIANAYLYLASDLASYVTGTVLRVDGAAMN